MMTKVAASKERVKGSIFSIVGHTALNLVKSVTKKIIYFSTKTYLVGTQKNRLNEAVHLSTQ